MDHLLALRAFTRIAETGSFAKAADGLNLPRTTVSKLIADLERHLGTALLQRTTRRVQVTPEGAAYYERAMHVICAVEDMDADARQKRAQPKGTLRVDVGSSVANLILIPALPRFRKLYPDIDLQIGVSDRVADMIGEGVDCAIRGGPLNDSSLIAKGIGELEYVTCASHDYLQGRPPLVHPDDLMRGHVLLGYFSSLTGRALPFHFIKDRVDLKVETPAAIAVNESTAYNSALKVGLGVGQAFRRLIDAELTTGQLIPVLEDWSRPALPLYAVYPTNRYLNVRARVFIDWVAEVFAKRRPGSGNDEILRT